MISIFLSCDEKEDLQISEESPKDEINLNEELKSYSINFSMESEVEFETENLISFQNQSENLIEYHWDFGDGSTSVEKNSNHSYDEPGKYIVTLTGKTEEGTIEMTDSKEVFVRKKGSHLDLLFINYQDSTLNYFNLSTYMISSLYEVPYNPAGVLAVDENNSVAYYYDYTNNKILANSLFENNPFVLLDNFAGVSDMEFDQDANKLFIARSYDDLILTYDVATKTIRQTTTAKISGSKFGKVRDMDLKDGQLYTITPTQSYESVFKVDIANGNLKQLINYQNGGFGYGVAFDDRNDDIYFNNVEEAALMRAASDGSNIEKIIDLDRFGKVSFAELCLTGLKVIESRNLLLWSAWDDSALHILNLENLQEGVFNVEGLNGKFVPFENDRSTNF